MSTVTMDVVSKLSNLLPTGTFISFQALAPLFTNNGVCGNIEKIMTGVLLVTFAIICWILNFTDSVTTEAGKVHYGIVTRSGLFNPQFKGSDLVGVEGYFYDNPEKKYRVNGFDFVNGIFDIIALAALTMLTPPITTCYYPDIPNTIVKTVPIIAAIFVVAYFAIAPAPRNGIGFSVPKKTEEVHDQKKQPDRSEDSFSHALLTSRGQGPREQKHTSASSTGGASV